MAKKQHGGKRKTREYAYLLEDVMKGNFKYAYRQEDLWELANRKDITMYKMSDVKHWIYQPCWSINNGKCFLSIYQVLLQAKKFPNHIRRIKKADISYPLIIIQDKYDKFGTILDGNHRFAKMILEKRRTIPIVYFTKKELEKIKLMM